MYLGHLTAYRRDLELWEDYDFALRATEQTQAIFYIPHVLYHWREHAVSGSVGGKPKARKTNLALLLGT